MLSSFRNAICVYSFICIFFNINFLCFLLQLRRKIIPYGSICHLFHSFFFNADTKCLYYFNNNYFFQYIFSLEKKKIYQIIQIFLLKVELLALVFFYLFIFTKTPFENFFIPIFPISTYYWSGRII